MTEKMGGALGAFDPTYNQHCRLENLDAAFLVARNAIKLCVKNKHVASAALGCLDVAMECSAEAIVAESAEASNNGVEWPPALTP